MNETFLRKCRPTLVIAADEQGNKSLLAVNDGFRESKESWLCVLRQLKQQGLNKAPNVTVGDGALGFWGAMNEVFPKASHQRCWVHKTANVLDKLPKSQRGQAKSMLHDIYLAESKKDAEQAMQSFQDHYSLKYPKAAECLAKDKDELLTFYQYPAEHWCTCVPPTPLSQPLLPLDIGLKNQKTVCLAQPLLPVSLSFV